MNPGRCGNGNNNLVQDLARGQGLMSGNRVEARRADAAQQRARTAISLRERALFALVAFQSHSAASEVKGFQGNIQDAQSVTSKPFFITCLSKITCRFTREGCTARRQWKVPEAEQRRMDGAESAGRLERSKANEIFQYPLTGARRENMKSLWGAI